MPFLRAPAQPDGNHLIPDTLSSIDLGQEKEPLTEFIEDMDHTVSALSRYR
jgi:hypothetical protein